jgi:hypothetical protein
MLECWNTGIMGIGILQGWVNVLPKAERTKNLKSIISFKKPLFHPSTIPLFHGWGQNSGLK